MTHIQSEILRHLWPSSSSAPNAQATRRKPDSKARQASHSVRIGSRSWPPSRLSQPPPASRDTVAVGADPGSEISITLGTDCTATTVPHTGSREILPFRTRGCCSVPPLLHCAVCAIDTVPPMHKQHAPSPGPIRQARPCRIGQSRGAGRQARQYKQKAKKPPVTATVTHGHAARTASSSRWPGRSFVIRGRAEWPPLPLRMSPHFHHFPGTDCAVYPFERPKEPTA